MLSVAGASLEVVERGRGRPLLFLHAGEGLAPERPWLDLLARRYRVIAPWHPGWGNSPLIDGMGAVDDLAYLYLDLAAELGWTTRCWSAPALAAGSRPRSWYARPRGSLVWSWSTRSGSNSPAGTSATSPTCTRCPAPNI